MKKDDIEQFFSRLKELNPNPKSDLEYTNSFTLLVAVLLSAQSTDAGVNKATKNLFKIADTPEKMLHLGEDGIKAHIKTIGLYNNKAKNIVSLSEILLEKFDGAVPGTREDLMSLPGVGRKTANVVLNIAYGQPTMAVDTHIFRVSNRTGLAPGKTPEEVERHLLDRVPAEYALNAHHWLILLGRYTCKARKPLCGQCPVSYQCKWKEKN